MGRFFEGFRPPAASAKVIWQEHESLFPFKCGQCKREFPQGGKRYLASSLSNHSHHAAAVRCDDCHNGIDPNRRKAPVLAERRTELD
ncbi:hypothetical protein SD70_02400 [Gordoniibacillus kamchatkensis]|uniref:C2H2-type domain-containing protein n=1 Tax=Gordoniibacillus kamchatkensis TaxID=1590651 RepID=A0ABR5AM10_9BACL|nr:hypothetical protein [Paenibacillus sp. VKM B-2647]KIL42056.1 hypothetical protein SD70_02400 [Paenibacillus sp. VKM B-2647]